jgi:hypothetical protein
MDPKAIRINNAWQQTKEWITQFEGSASEAFLPNLDVQSLGAQLFQLAGETRDFRMAAVAPDNSEQEIEVSLESLAKNLEDYLQGEIEGLNGNFSAQIEELLVDFHFILHILRGNAIGMELVWWADQVFEEEADSHRRFDLLIDYLMHLEVLFKATGLFLGQENLEEPGVEAIQWISV